MISNRMISNDQHFIILNILCEGDDLHFNIPLNLKAFFNFKNVSLRIPVSIRLAEKTTNYY